MANLKTHHDRTGLDHLAPSTHPARGAASFRRILAARRELAAAEQELRDAVHADRKSGDSWTVIGPRSTSRGKRHNRDSGNTDSGNLSSRHLTARTPGACRIIRGMTLGEVCENTGPRPPLALLPTSPYRDRGDLKRVRTHELGHPQREPTEVAPSRHSSAGSLRE